ncbi:MAG: enoyl-CoA hydratase/isomerase family protein [Hyphomicrobiaceae bacterium]
MEAGVGIVRRGALAVITLNRPATGNAISIAMRATIAQAFAGFGRDTNLYAVALRTRTGGPFCSGGDMQEIVALAQRDLAAARRAVADDLTLCWVAECLSKPSVSLVDGAVTGIGIGITLYNTHRVAGPSYAFSMPEAAIGYLPQCGVARAAARMPHGIGHYLALTGRSIGRADALALGLVTHCIGPGHFDRIEELLADAEPVDQVLDGLHEDPGPSPLMADAARIERYFAAPSLREIAARLAAAPANDRAFAQSVEDALARRSPLALHVTDRMIRTAQSLDIQGALIRDYRVAHRFLGAPDFQAGVPGPVDDPERAPRWQHASLDAVPEADIAAYFEPLGDAELPLPSRQQMQAART